MHRLSIQCKIMCRQFAVRHVAQCFLVHSAYLLRWRPFRSGWRTRGIPGLECRTFSEARAAPRCLISRTNERFPQAPEGKVGLVPHERKHQHWEGRLLAMGKAVT